MSDTSGGQSGKKNQLLATHDEVFHLDDVFGYAILLIALGLSQSGVDHCLIRTRNRELFVNAEIVWDVGDSYDPEKCRFDHHQLDGPLREGGLPLSASGLIWRHFGLEAVKRVLGNCEDASTIAQIIDRELIVRIDEIDNGIGDRPDSLSIGSIIDDLNPAWNIELNELKSAQDNAFIRAAFLARGILENRIKAILARTTAHRSVEACKSSFNSRILEMGSWRPWTDAVLEHEMPVDYAVYPSRTGNWVVEAARISRTSFESRVPLPTEWAGKKGRMLVEVTGVADAVFVHQNRFLAIAGSRAGALSLARKALRNNLKSDR